MCKTGFIFWSCHHYYQWTHPCQPGGCGRTTTTPPAFKSWECSPACCQQNLNRKLSPLKEFEDKYKIPSGGSVGNMAEGEKNKYWKEDRARLSKEASILKREISNNTQRHLRTCSVQHAKGNMLTNVRKKEMGWMQHIPTSLALPPAHQQNKDYQALLKAWEDSEVFRSDSFEYSKAEANGQLARIPAPEIPPNHMPTAWGSGAYVAINQHTQQEQARRRAEENQGHADEAGLARELYPLPQQPIHLGQSPDIRSTPRPSKQSSIAPEERHGVVLTEEDEQIISYFFEEMAENFGGSDREVAMGDQQLRRLRDHLENITLFGADPKFHAVDYVIHERSLMSLWHLMGELEKRLLSVKAENRISPENFDILYNLHSQNDQWIREHITALGQWVAYTATDLQIQQMVWYQAYEGELQRAQAEQRAAQRGAGGDGHRGGIATSGGREESPAGVRLPHSRTGSPYRRPASANNTSSRRSDSTDSRDSQGNLRFITGPEGRGRVPNVPHVAPRPGTVSGGAGGTGAARAGSGSSHDTARDKGKGKEADRGW